jgi:hypothetical protein
LGPARSVRSRQTPRCDIQAGFSQTLAGSMAATALNTGQKVRFNRAKLDVV